MRKLYLSIFSILFLVAPISTSSLAFAKEPKSEVYEPAEALVVLKNADAELPNTNPSRYKIEKLSADESSVFLVKSHESDSTNRLVRRLEKNSRVAYAQPNFKYRSLARVTNDSRQGDQWALMDTSEVPGGVSARSAWDLEQKKQTKVAIAVIDSGISYNATDLKECQSKGSAKGKNFESPKKKPKDMDGHGSFLSGIIAAKSNNKKGLAGASYFNNLKVMPLKFDFTTAQAVTAINFAKTKQVPIINASWGNYGSDGFDQLLSDAIASYGGVFVTSAGNDSIDHDSGNEFDKMYPCDFTLANILCVAASDREGNLADYSDTGATSIDVSAPGGNESNPIVVVDIGKSSYSFAEGSSLATAYVAAEAGLILSKKPMLSSLQIIEIIKNSVDVLPGLAGKNATGGKINYRKALDLALTYYSY